MRVLIIISKFVILSLILKHLWYVGVLPIPLLLSCTYTSPYSFQSPGIKLSYKLYKKQLIPTQ